MDHPLGPDALLGVDVPLHDRLARPRRRRPRHRCGASRRRIGCSARPASPTSRRRRSPRTSSTCTTSPESPDRQSSSAARLATSLRSQEVSVMWPKHDWPRNDCVSTASALFDSPRYGRVDLARVAGEDDLGALPDPGEDRAQRGRLEVLRLVDHDDLALQRPAAEERHRLQRQLTPVRRAPR